MARFRVTYNLEEFGYLYFDSPDEDSADELLRQVQQGILDFEDLPNFYKKISGGSESIENDLEEAI
jgi:hypothetical protein